VRCVQGPVISGKGLNYKTGHAKSEKVHKKTVIVVSGMKLGSCYKFRAFDHSHDFLSNVNGTAYNTEEAKDDRVFKVIQGLSGAKNTVSINTISI